MTTSSFGTGRGGWPLRRGAPWAVPAPRARAAGVVLAAVIIELTAATAYIHLSLGGTLFLLNALGFLALGAAYLIGAFAPFATIRRFGWLPRIALAAYALLTIGAYLVQGPYFALGWVAKGIEIAIIGLVIVDLLTTDAPDSGGRKTDAAQHA